MSAMIILIPIRITSLSKVSDDTSSWMGKDKKYETIDTTNVSFNYATSFYYDLAIQFLIHFNLKGFIS